MSPERESPERILEGRLSLETLYQKYFKLIDYGFTPQVAYHEEGVPVWCFKSKPQGRATWIIGGIHGEEPAGPNAIAEAIPTIGEVGKSKPVVVYPMCNPVAYQIDWRYFDEPRNKDIGHSVADAIHYLKKGKKPTSKYAEELTAHVLRTTKRYPPNLVLDLHEDEDITAPYFYFYGSNLDIPKIAIEIAERNGLVIQKSGETDRGEKIVDGVVLNSEDDSIDELLFARAIRKSGTWVDGPTAKAVLVVETPVLSHLSTRIEVQKEIIRTFI